MDYSRDCSLLNALDVLSPKSHGPRSSRFDDSSSERDHRGRRWSPYTRKRKLLPKKSFSLETLPLLRQIERSRSFELTQSTEDQTSVNSESTISSENDCSTVAALDQTTDLLPALEDELDELSIDLANDSSIVAESDQVTEILQLPLKGEFSIDLENDYSNGSDGNQATEWLQPTLEYLGICLENDYSANTSRPITECLHRSMESELTFEHGDVCQSEAETSQLIVNLTQSTSHPPETSQMDSRSATKTSQSLTEWLLWSAYAKLMKLTWRNARKTLNEQNHRAENCELQIKSTMTQIFSMKSQLKADIREMKDNVKKIQSMRVILESTEEDENRLQTENNTLKAKIECLNEQRSKLRQEISEADQAMEAFHAEAESMKNQIKAWDDEMTELKREKQVLDEEIQELISLTEQTKENVTTGQKNIYNVELEIDDIKRELAASKEKIAVETRLLRTVRAQAQVVSNEIKIATEGAEVFQKQLAETRDKVMDRDSMIAELSAKVASAEEQISSMKGSTATIERKSFLRRFQFLPNDSPSLFSIRLWD